MDFVAMEKNQHWRTVTMLVKKTSKIDIFEC